jgi:two-component system sensor kinase FixL
MPVMAAMAFRRASERAKQPAGLLALVHAAIPEAMLSFDTAGRLHSLNPLAERLFGYRPSAEGRQDVNRLLPALCGGSKSLAEASPDRLGLIAQMVGCRSDGSRFTAEVSIGAIGVGAGRLYVGIVRDLGLSERSDHRVQELQADLFHAIRLSEMGHVAAGLAHELAQPLAAIGNYAQAGQLHRQPGEQPTPAAQQLFERIALQARRASDMVNRLRGFLAKRGPKRQNEDLGDIVEEAVGLALPGKRDRRLRIVKALDHQGLAVNVDRVQVLQVLVNLLRNAADATKGLPARRIVIASSLEGRDDIRIAIADNGRGLSGDLDDRAFNAFVTTKPDGMGLGLSISKMIIEDHGGRIWHAGNEFGGATFYFTLKRADVRTSRFDKPEKKHA